MLKFILVFLLSFPAFGQVKYIDKGTPAPYNGYLFTVEKTKSVRKELIEKDQLKIFTKALLENEVRYKTIIKNGNTQVELLKKQNDSLMKENAAKDGLLTIERVLWFGLGFAVTSFAVYGAKQIVR